jgi:nucleolar protein 56
MAEGGGLGMSSTQRLFVLFEHASGYALFRVKEFDQMANDPALATDSALFASVVKFVAFSPFSSGANALDNANMITEGIIHDNLQTFLEANLPHEKKSKIALGVSDGKLGAAIMENLEINCFTAGSVPEIMRGIKQHFHFFVKGLTQKSEVKAQLGLCHGFSRCKVKFNVNRADNMIIQSISLLDQLDKDINTFCMRIREWYSYHFPELYKIVKDNHMYAKLVNLIEEKKTCEFKEEQIAELVMDEDIAKQIVSASKSSMGMDISPIDLLNIQVFSTKAAALVTYRKQLYEYLQKKMLVIAPNLSTLIGEIVGARLICHAGSLINLAKYPASTIQILGAEKALFRALKTKSKTPKYGLIFHSSFIGRAETANKGKISRYLANKCAIASRLDCFSEKPNAIIGCKLKTMVEERLNFFSTGVAPKTNDEFMAEALEELAEFETMKKAAKQKKKAKKLAKVAAEAEAMET